MMHSWQTLLLLISVPILVLSSLSILGTLVRLLPYVFLSVFGFGGIFAIIDSFNRVSIFGFIELLLGSFITLIVIVNLFLVISNHRQTTAILRTRNPRMPIRNIVLDTKEKPSFPNPHANSDSFQARVRNKLKVIKHKATKATKDRSKHMVNLPPKHGPQF